MTITGGRLIRAMLDDEDGHRERTTVNKRILELAEQADIEWLLEHHPKLEKFAKLIIEECVDYALANGDNVDYLKQYFGVEE